MSVADGNRDGDRDHVGTDDLVDIRRSPAADPSDEFGNDDHRIGAADDEQV